MQLFRLFSLLLALTMPLSVFARPIPQEDLERVNQFLKTIAGSLFSDKDVEGGFVSGEESDAGLVTALGIDIKITKHSNDDALARMPSRFNMSIDVADNVKIELGAIHYTKFEFQELIEAAARLPEFHRIVGKEGLYEGSSQVTFSNAILATLRAGIRPVSENARLLKSVDINASADLSLSKVEGDANGVFNIESELVSKCQTGFTKVFNSLRASQMPSAEDSEELREVLTLIMEKIGNSIPGGADEDL